MECHESYQGFERGTISEGVFFRVEFFGSFFTSTA